MSVNSFHNFCIPIKNMSRKFSVIALDQDNNVEILNIKKKIYGFMWHPERNRNYKELNMIIKKLIKKMKIVLLCAGRSTELILDIKVLI